MNILYPGFFVTGRVVTGRFVTVSLSDGDLRIGPCRSQQLGQRQEAGAGRAGPGTR